VNPHEAIDRDFDAHLERIRDFLRIPSVSAYDGDLRSTADAVCEVVERGHGRRREFDTAPDRKRGSSCSSSFVTARIG
jgi:hypothetical protein